MGVLKAETIVIAHLKPGKEDFMNEFRSDKRLRVLWWYRRIRYKELYATARRRSNLFRVRRERMGHITSPSSAHLVLQGDQFTASLVLVFLWRANPLSKAHLVKVSKK